MKHGLHIYLVCYSCITLYFFNVFIDDLSVIRTDLFRGHEFIYCGKELHLLFENYGIELHFPKNKMDRKVSVMVALKTLDDEYSLPENSEIVSAIYRICVNGELPIPVSVKIQHCVSLRHNNALSFVRSETKHGPTCQFTVIEGGRFKPDSFYGEIDLTCFSDIGIIRFFGGLFVFFWSLFQGVSESSIYCTSVYRKQILLYLKNV